MKKAQISPRKHCDCCKGDHPADALQTLRDSATGASSSACPGCYAAAPARLKGGAQAAAAGAAIIDRDDDADDVAAAAGHPDIVKGDRP